MRVLLMATERAIHIMPTLNFFQRFLNYSHCTKSIQQCWVAFHTQLKRFMNWVDRRPNLFWFLNFLCTLFDPVQPHQFPLTKPRKFWKVALLWFIWLLVAPQRDGKILDFYHDYLHGGLNFFRVFLWYHWFSLISLLPWKNKEENESRSFFFFFRSCL